MLYSVEDNVKPLKNVNQREINKRKINDDLEDSQNNEIYYKPRKEIENGDSHNQNLEESHDKVNGLKSQNSSANVTPNGRIRIKHNKVPSQSTDKKSFRSKLSTVSKGNRSRVTNRRAGSMAANTNVEQTGTISLAMQILNMDEEEKE